MAEEMTAADLDALISGGPAPANSGGSSLDRIFAQYAGSAGAAKAEDPYVGDFPEGFTAGGTSTSSIRPDWAGPQFQQDMVIPGRPARFRQSDLTAIQSWPVEKRARLVLQMQKAGLVSPNVDPRYWNPKEFTKPLEEALAFANANGIDDPFQAVGMYGVSQAETTKQNRPTFNFVSRDFLPPDPAAVDASIRDLAKQMFQGTDIELSDEEVQQLRGQFEGFLREQHFAAEQQRLSEEHSSFDAKVASAEGRKVDVNVDAVPQVDAEARFRQLFEERMKPKTDAIEQMAVDDESRQVLAGSLGQVMQFATGR